MGRIEYSEELLSSREVATILRSTIKTVNIYIQKGLLESVTIPGVKGRKIPRYSVDSLLKARKWRTDSNGKMLKIFKWLEDLERRVTKLENSRPVSSSKISAIIDKIHSGIS